MIIAVASGKGGTGKTTIAVTLAAIASAPVRLLDCDVEEPNCHLFINPEITDRRPVEVMVPELVEGRCDACGACSTACRFNAIAAFGAEPLIFPELCHGCAGCVLACPQEALRETERRVGVVESGTAAGHGFTQGLLDVRQVLAPPVIRAAKERINPEQLNIVDCPPGTSCPMVEAVRGSDFVLLVTEPTPFGLHDLKLAVETLAEIGLPCGVVVNRSDGEDRLTVDYCATAGVPVLARIPFDRRIAEVCSRGGTLLEAMPEVRGELVGLLRRAGELATRCVEVR